MSKPDFHDFDYPPGLGAQRARSAERDQLLNFTSGVINIGPDRRISNGNSQTISGYSPGLTRLHPQESHRDYTYGLPELAGPNRHNSTSSLAHFSSQSPFSTFNHNHHRPSPPPQNSATSSPAALFSSSPVDRFPFDTRQHHQSNAFHQVATTAAPHNTQPSTPNSLAARSTLWWGELEPWMDEEYAKQVCNLMGWDPVTIKVPHPAPDPATGQQSNNPGYCFLTFPTPAHAASVLNQVNQQASPGQSPAKPSSLTMPNSTKPFVMNWASSMLAASPLATAFSTTTTGAQSAPTQQYPKEYSIFVGDLAPETSNSDLVAVFRNPVLGLRNDREPKFIRPFLSCKSAKIMLDPVTGVSRGYGFVRFTDEADQQRALIEMHGLYCLSRPMRISPATAKFRAPPTQQASDLPQVSFTPPVTVTGGDPATQPVTIALPLPNAAQTKSVSAPIAAAGSNTSLSSNTVSGSVSGSSIGGSHSSNSLSSATGSSTSISTSAFGSISTEDMMHLPSNVLAQIAQQYAQGDTHATKPAYDSQIRQNDYVLNEESWKHHVQARAILGNLIGPNGEQLTSTDPYNTTVFVGGLSPLISEETLRTFFAPFGDIHYVKVPVGKHCGFVQFVRKADAEKAIEKMQGFPIGGSRIRLSWGRSQYKAAQAAAQAAQAAALQSPYSSNTGPSGTISQDQAIQLLQQFTRQGYFNPPSTHPAYDSADVESALLNSNIGSAFSNGLSSASAEAKAGKDDTGLGTYLSRSDIHRSSTSFSPFSPDPNNLYTSSDHTAGAQGLRRESTPFASRLEALPHPSKAYAPGFFPPQDLKVNTAAVGGTTQGQGKTSPPGHVARPPSATRYSFTENTESSGRAGGRSEAPISRPSSGQQQQEADIQDLNGTLASLDLDRDRPERLSPWSYKSTEASGR
ncbi:hypothetical protein CVT24_003020 [Panaeolus cyanescens]|uniref:RRM domain-containing protein n=1 Tax=Panaeolus cyanescens TaxID=181874 RepID=A0A409W8U5_9AGAR|nr:hypothetical protein CVT24_003020 [Panaeolus cyanescens]